MAGAPLSFERTVFRGRMAEPSRHPTDEKDQRAIRRGIRGALIFGIVAATIEMAFILGLMYS